MTDLMLNIKAVDAGYLLIVSEGKYAKLVDASGNEVVFTPNPAIMRGATIAVEYDSTTGTFTPLEPISEFDDRYAFNLQTFSPVALGSTPTYSWKPTTNPDSTFFNLHMAYSDASIHPVLIIEVFEQRLSSFDYYIYVGEELTDANAATYLGYTKDQLINALAADYVSKAQAHYDATYGAGSVTVSYDPVTREFNLYGLVQFDGQAVAGETAQTVARTSPHIMVSGGFTMPIAVKIPGRDWFNMRKVFSGAYILFHPDKLSFFPAVVQAAVDQLTTLPQDQKDKLIETLTYSIGDWFRGSAYEVTIDGKTVFANVFVSVLGSGHMLATVTVEDPANPGTFLEVAALPVSLTDALDYKNMEFSFAYPDALRYVTGPYGSLPIRDPQTGNIIGYASDSYTY